MTAGEVADVEGILVMAGLLAVLVLVAARAVPSARPRIDDALRGTATMLAAGVALLAMAGSLWFSEEAGFPPCELCWYQRIAMYPLVVVLGVAAVRGSASGRITGLVLAGLGLAVSAWHNVIETAPDLDRGGCDPAVPCTVRWVEGLGFWTIPRMAAACFVLIVVLTTLDHLAQRPSKETPT